MFRQLSRYLSAGRFVQFRLSTLFLWMSLCAGLVTAVAVLLPRYVDGYKIVSGHLHLHLTPAAQELFFDPPRPMGPMHETKVFGLRRLAYRAAATAVFGAAFLWWWCSRKPKLWTSGTKRERLG